MHPSIQISVFIVTAVALSLGSMVSLGCAVSLLVLLSLTARRYPSALCWKLLRRLKWLFISIVVVYGWMTPGDPVIAGLGISQQGLLLALHRGLVLVVIVFAVDFMLQQLDKGRLLQGVYWLASPFSRVGLDLPRFASRVVLTMNYAFEGQGSPKADGVNRKSGFSEKTKAIVAALYQRFVSAVNDTSTPDTLEINIGRPPVWFAWTIPVALAALFYSVEKVL